MIPSVVATEVLTSLRDFIATGFKPSNPEISSLIDDFLAKPENLAKGPYISISLPFENSSVKGEPFPKIPLEFQPYEHQNRAFSRLSPSKSAQSTIIATGTGSGKTESFLYPILEHCQQNSQKSGIKAILIYPMNALANDQARRLAHLIYNTPSLHTKVTAGLYIGKVVGGDELFDSKKRDKMTLDHIIENREVLRNHPPDILLTNYKMLDYLLTRPKDIKLWEKNKPDSLKYLVVDELHTFDGAQGTDLACLIRRLKFRLSATDQHVVCVGTSATIGAKNASKEIIGYANKIFQEQFTEDSIITEVRKSREDFLAKQPISCAKLPDEDLYAGLHPQSFGSSAAYIESQIKSFFDNPVSIESKNWPVELGKALHGHIFLRLLLSILQEPMTLQEIYEKVRFVVPNLSQEDAENLIISFLALISVARNANETDDHTSETPFLEVKVHLWLRELRRMVSSLGQAQSSNPNVDSDSKSTHLPQIKFSDDIGSDEKELNLPIVQCRKCKVTGWVCVKKSVDKTLVFDLKVIYNYFFSKSKNISFAYPKGQSNQEGDEFLKLKVCSNCGFYTQYSNQNKCSFCNNTKLTELIESTQQHIVKSVNNSKVYVCPFCKEPNGPFIFGARSTTEMSVALAKLYGSKFINEKRVIAFSDNVQNAAHRAGFVASRTWKDYLRSAIYQAALRQSDDLTLSEFIEKIPSSLNKNLDPLEFVSTYFPPDKRWWRDYLDLCSDNELPKNSNLEDLILKRLQWDTSVELTFHSNNRLSLEQTGCVAVGINEAKLETASEELHQQLSEKFGDLKHISIDDVEILILGIFRRMRQLGAVKNRLISTAYLTSGGFPGTLGRYVRHLLPESAEGQRLPNFLWYKQNKDRRFDYVFKQKSWFVDWLKINLFQSDLIAGDIVDALKTVVNVLVAHKLLLILPPNESKQVLAINPDNLYVTTDVSHLKTQFLGHSIVVPKQEASIWENAPNLQLSTTDRYKNINKPKISWVANNYKNSDIHRVNATEYTALTTKDSRARIQKQFSDNNPKMWWPNFLSATPALELGVDIGDLSTVILCSVPPSNTNYIQRIGRAGRRDGNSLSVTIANGKPHDLFHYEEPKEMISANVTAPGVFLNAPAVLERQLIAFCIDSWIRADSTNNTIPDRIGTVLNRVRAKELSKFPYNFFEYVDENGKSLLNEFTGMFTAEEITLATKNYLQQFICGDLSNGSSNELKTRMLSRFKDVASERKALESDIKKLKNELKKLKGLATDQNTEKQRKIRKNSIKAKYKLRSQISNKNTFAFFSDEGLLPNYAFPQEGVKLRSEIQYGRFSESDDRNEFRSEIFEYVRPGSSALYEMSPGSYFYAEARRVRVSRIDLMRMKSETWRFCPDCSFCEKENIESSHSICPSCHSSAWSDQFQLVKMHLLSCVHSEAISDRKSRILDEREDREPIHLKIKLAVEFKEGSAGNAFVSVSEDVTLAFDYFGSTKIREINFGKTDPNETWKKIDNEILNCKGYRVCGGCGTVQGNKSTSHEFWCNQKHNTQAIIENLCLYREFESEAIRLFLPFESVSPSCLTAAIELGLRTKFAGEIGHLKVHVGQYPLGKNKLLERCFVLYDTVPGGTGYLKELTRISHKFKC